MSANSAGIPKDLCDHNGSELELEQFETHLVRRSVLRAHALLWAETAPSSTPAPIQVSPQSRDAEPLTHRMFILFYTKITHALNMVHMILELE